jgi:hypothetical protein
MSEAALEIVKGISRAAGDAYDGAMDENGEPIKFGLKREEGNPLLDRRTMDGFGCKVSGTKLIMSYHSEIQLKEVYGNDFEGEIEQRFADIVAGLKKRYRHHTSKTLGLKALGEADSRVEKVNNHRVHVTAQKMYEIAGMDGVEVVAGESNPEDRFKEFLAQNSDKRPDNDTRKAE